jgi:hypothetical protein
MNIASGYHKLSSTNKRAYLTNRVIMTEDCKTRKYYLENDVTSANFRIPVQPHGPNRVCSTFFYWCTRSSTNKVFQPSLHAPGSGHTTIIVEKISPTNRPAPFLVDVRTWLLTLAAYYLISPDSQYTYIPFANKDDVFSLYEQERPNGAKVVYFKATWRDDPQLDHIRIRRYLRFAKCDECTDNLEASHKTHDRAERKVILSRHRIHLQFVKLERDSYYQRRTMARQLPGEYMSLIIDGSDTSWYHFPYFKRISHSSQNKWKVGIHVMGCINHGRGSSIVTYIDNVKQGTNVTIEVLHRELVKTIETEGKLPKKLFLQLDNTTKQCKSKYVIGYLARLVRDGVFDEVILSFLPVGHTHEDIDQLFSRLAIWLRTHDCLSRLDLTKAAAHAFESDQERPTIAHMDRVANISDYLEPYVRQLKGITKYHQFKISYVGDETSTTKRSVRLRARVWITPKGEDARWTGILPYTRDSLIFNAEPETREWLNAMPFSDDAVPVSQRKQKKISSEGSLLGDRARLVKDVEGMIAARKIPPEHAVDLRECLALCTDPPEAPQIALPFIWDTELYTSAFHKLQKKPAQDQRKLAEERRDQLNKEATVGFPVMVKGDGTEAGVTFWLGKVTGDAVLRQDDNGKWEAVIPIRWYKSETDFGTYKLQTGNDGIATLVFSTIQYFCKWALTKKGTISKNTDEELVKYYADSWALEKDEAKAAGDNEHEPSPEPEDPPEASPSDPALRELRAEARARLHRLGLQALLETYIARAGPSQLKFLTDTMDETARGRSEGDWDPTQRHLVTAALAKRKKTEHSKSGSKKQKQ